MEGGGEACIGGDTSTAASSSSSGSQSLEVAGKDVIEEMLTAVEARWMTKAKSADGGSSVCCVVCSRPGHPCCGQRYWVSIRAAWLRNTEEHVARLPDSFEDPGFLQAAGAADEVSIRELSEGELEDLEECLDAVQRPFPRLRRSIPLSQAVLRAENLWDAED